MQINILKNRVLYLGDQRIHQGIAFEWIGEEVIFADIDYPVETTPTGLPIVAYFVNLEANEAADESLLQIIEEDFKLRQGINIEHFVTILIKSELGSTEFYGFHKKDGEIQKCEVLIIDTKLEPINSPLLYIDLDIFSNKKVVIAGCGTFGSGLALEMCKSGINNFILVDNSRYNKNEIHRSCAYPIYEGRKKNQVLKEAILTMNPSAKVLVLDLDITAEPEKFKKECKNANVIFGLTNQRSSFFILNQIAVDLNIPTVFAIANNLASFGYIYRFDPANEKSPCFNCMGIGQFFLRGETIYYERSGYNANVGNSLVLEKEESQNYDLLPYIYMLARTCFEILSEGLAQSLPGINIEDAPLLLYPTGQISEGQDPINNKNQVDYKKMYWYPVAINCYNGCPVCSSR